MGVESGATAPAASTTALPEQFGKYSLLGHLATGGMAEVYLARQAGLQGFEKVVVIKRIRPEMNDRDTVSMFVDEARLVATLEHPNIAQVYEIGMVQDSYFFVMEYVHGADVRHLLEASLKKKRKLSLADCVYIMIHVCAALHHAHEKTDHNGTSLGIIHRDVSPSNVLLSHDGAIKVCDFGIAKASGRTVETSRGTLKGKFAYMSPEQCRCEDLDRRSDIFSIGILLYELTTMSRLFKAPSDFELMRQIVEVAVPPPSSRVPEYPPELERIVFRALAKNRDDRYATAQELQLELEEFAREHKLAMSSVSVARTMGELFEKRLDAWAKAKQAGKGLEDHIMDTAIRRNSSDNLPVFFPLGSQQDGDIEIGGDALDTTPHRLASMEMPAVRPTPAPTMTPLPFPAVVAPGRRGPNPLLLVGCVVAGLVAGGVTLAQSTLATTAAKTSTIALEGSAEKISTAIESAARAAHMRADGFAATPMLRAAIETDAATMKDLAEHEYTFSVAKSEMLEIYQLRGEQTASLLRLPAGAVELPPLKPQESRLQLIGKDPFVIASAPIAGHKSSVAGVLEIAVPIDLGASRRSIAQHATRVVLSGAGADVVLVDGPAAKGVAPVTVPVSAADTGATLTLVVTPRVEAAVAGWAWAGPVRYTAVGLGVLLLLLYVAGFRRKALDQPA